MTAGDYRLRTSALTWRVHVHGAGNPRILLLHGAGGAGHLWEPFVRALGPGVTCLAPDLPGHGGSALAPDRALSLPGMADALGELLDELGAAPDVLVGHSAGAAIAAQLVLAGHVRPRFLCGIAPALLLPGLEHNRVLWPLVARVLTAPPLARAATALFGWRGSLRAVIAGTGSVLDEDRLAAYEELTRHPAHLHGVLSMFAHWDVNALLPRLGTITCPVLLVAGERDPWFPPALVAGLAARFPSARCATLPAGHLLVDEAPERLAALLRPSLA